MLDSFVSKVPKIILSLLSSFSIFNLKTYLKHGNHPTPICQPLISHETQQNPLDFNLIHPIEYTSITHLLKTCYPSTPVAPIQPNIYDSS